MSSGAIDPLAVTKRVFWRPYDTTIVLKAGDPVCYRLDAADHKKRIVDPVHLGLTRDTYVEGEQEMTGRLFCVEEPLVDNIDAFAGIVKCLGPEDGADGDFIEIFKANSGAVVPANIVLTSTTAGRTLLAVMVGTRTLGSPTQDCPDFEDESDTDNAGDIDSKVVGVAMETLTAAGLCWVKLDENMFIHQGGQIGQDFLVTSVADDVTVNKMFLKIAVTAGHCQALHYRTVLTGAGGDANRGVYRFETVMRGIPANSKQIFGVNIHLEIGADFGAGGGSLSPLLITLRTKNTNPDLSGVGRLSAIQIEWILRKDTGSELDPAPCAGAARCSSIFYINTDSSGTQPDFFLTASHHSVVCSETTVVGQGKNAARSIKVNIQNIAYWIPTYSATDLA